MGAASQGYSVALSADGNTAIVGGNDDNSQLGAAWVFTRTGGVWAQQGPKLVGTGAVGPAEPEASVPSPRMAMWLSWARMKATGAQGRRGSTRARIGEDRPQLSAFDRRGQLRSGAARSINAGARPLPIHM